MLTNFLNLLGILTPFPSSQFIVYGEKYDDLKAGKKKKTKNPLASWVCFPNA